MQLNEPTACAKIAACICGKDGVISEAELKKMFEILNVRFPEFGAAMFEEALDDFFESGDEIEDLLSLINEDKLRRFTLRLSELSASADGLDARENVALEKAYQVWGVQRHV